MEAIIDWALKNPEKSIPIFGAALGLVLGGFWTALTFFQKILAEKEQKQFDRYQLIVDQLNKGKDGQVYVDFQLNAVYEMRFFRKYFPRSERIVELLIPRWIASDSYNDENVEELRATLRYIRARKSPLLTIPVKLINLFWPVWK